MIVDLTKIPEEKIRTDTLGFLADVAIETAEDRVSLFYEYSIKIAEQIGKGVVSLLTPLYFLGRGNINQLRETKKKDGEYLNN